MKRHQKLIVAAVLSTVGAACVQAGQPVLAKKRPFVLRHKRRPFSIRLKPSIRPLAPKVKRKLYAGSLFELAWKGFGYKTTALRLEYHNPKLYPPTIKIPIGTKPSPSGILTWRINEKFVRKIKVKSGFSSYYKPVSAHGVIRFMGMTNDQVKVQATVPVTVYIPSVKLVSPKERSNVYGGLWYTVRWKAYGATAPKVKLRLGKNEGMAGIRELWSKVVKNTGSCRLQMPKNMYQAGSKRDDYYFGVMELFAPTAWREPPVKSWVQIRLY